MGLFETTAFLLLGGHPKRRGKIHRQLSVTLANPKKGCGWLEEFLIMACSSRMLKLCLCSSFDDFHHAFRVLVCAQH